MGVASKGQGERCGGERARVVGLMGEGRVRSGAQGDEVRGRQEARAR